MDNMAANTSVDVSTPDSIGPDITSEDAGAAAGASTNDVAASETVAQETKERDVTRTQAFSKRLKEYSDSNISAIGMTNPYNGQPIRNLTDLRVLGRMQREEARGRDPEEAAAEAALLERIGEYELREQENAITSNPDLAEYYDEYRDDVLAIAEAARASGNEVDLELALRVVMAQNYDDIRKRDAERIRQEITKNYDGKVKASPGSIGGSASTSAPDFAHMSDADFERYVSEVMQDKRHVGQ